MPTVYVTITTKDVAQAVADEINLDANLAIWSQSGFSCRRSRLPLHDGAALATLQLDVMAIKRERERSAERGATRAALESEHTVKVWMQKTVDSKPAVYEGQIDDLTAFLNQVDDYFLAKHRKLNQVAGHTAGVDNVYCIRSKAVDYSPNDLDERKLWVGVLELTFVERTSW